MSVLVDKNTRLVVQGITGSAGGFHARQCIDYGTNVVAGVTPGKGGQMFDGKVPVFDTVAEARDQTGCNVSMIFVPAPAAADPSDPYSGNVPYKIAGIGVDNAVSFYYQSAYALHDPRTGKLSTCLDMRAKCPAKEPATP